MKTDKKYELLIWTNEQAHVMGGLASERDGVMYAEMFQKAGHYTYQEKGEPWIRIPYHAITKFEVREE